MIRGHAQAPAFEVASVKANTSGDRRGQRIQLNLPDSFVSTNLPLRSVISMVYRVPAYKMSGGPSWIGTETFDITAKADHRLTQDEKLAMIRALLEDRFKLKTHRETRDGRIYALVLARSDGTLGPNIKETALDCAAITETRLRDGSRLPPPSGRGDAMPPCIMMGGGTRFRSTGTQMSGFVGTLGTIMQETIVDATGLTKFYEFDLNATDGASIFTALQEQLGLKLEPRRGPIETFVIDSAERPTPD